MVKTILSIVGLLLAGAIFFMYTQPGYDGVQVVQAEIREYNQALEKAAELQQLKQSLLSRYNAFNPADLDRLLKLLPDHVDNVRLVLDLDNLAARHGMALQNVVVSNPASEGAGTGGVVGTIGVGQQKYDSLILKFSTRSTYQNFTAFLLDIENSLRVVDLVSLSLERESESRGEPMFRYDLTIRTYWLK